ncbi:MAG: hypothetical protein FWD82_05990 [Defluviitaleaceae bacterium]|nr:hypothetical protein [Defluviitaleaceae bacterium]
MFEIIITVGIILAVIAGILYFLNQWASKRMSGQQKMIESSRQTITIYVIDKKRDKIQNANFPKSVEEQMPKRMKLMKFPLVKAKIGPQIVTLICDKKVFNALPVKKNVKVDVSGGYIVGMKGLKSEKEMKEAKKEKKK